MRGISPALPLTVNTRIRSIVEKECKKGKNSVTFKKRLSVIRDGIQGKSKYSTSKELGVSDHMINLWRTRWSESILKIERALEEGYSSRPIKDHEILDMIKEILSDRPRSGTPKRITMAMEELIVALACDKPENHGIKMTRWTYEMLAHVAIAEGIVHEISSRHVNNIIKKKTQAPQK